MSRISDGIITIEGAREEITQELQGWWEACMDEYKETAPVAFGLIRAFENLGLLTKDEAELWQLRIKNKCPEDEGHGGGRSWCAYCGNIPVPEESEEPA